jgi:MFS family permease
MQHATSLTSTFLVVVGISAIITQGVLVRKWLKTTNEVTLFRLGLVTVCGSLLLIPFLGWLGSYSLFLCSAALIALGSGMFNPSMAGLVSLTAPAERQGFGLSVNQSAAALGRIIGPTTAGLLFSFDASLPFFVGAVLIIVALAVSANTQEPVRS